MAKQRVQVRDLEAPDRIQPGPLKSDIYHRPAPPVEDESLKALERGLGAFASGLGRLHASQAAEQKKALTDQQLAEFEKWKAGTSSTEQLDAIRAGKLPMKTDLIYDQVVVQHYGGLEANRLASEIDAERQAGRIPFGSEVWDVDKYVREKAAPYVERINGRDARSMVAFGRNLSALRGALLGEHQKIAGEVNTRLLEDKGFQEINGLIKRGVENQASPEQITAGLRQLYGAIGPRAKKGSLDLSYGKMDELTLQSLEGFAKDPRYAAHAFALLDERRKGLDGETDIGALSGIYRHADKVASIKSTALKTMVTAEKDTRKTQVLAADMAALERQDGTFSTITDHKEKNPVDAAQEISFPASERREDAVRAWIEKTRLANGGKPNFEAEFVPLMNNGIKHPEYERLLNDTFAGILNTNVTTPGAPEQLAKVQEMATFYSKIADRNWAYAQTLVKGDAGKFFETYRNLTRFLGYDPRAAAEATVRAYSSAHAAKDPQIVQGRLTTIRDKVAKVDMSRWPFAGGIANQGTVKEILESTAETLARVEGVDADTAIERTIERIKTRSAYVNNRIVFDPGIQPGDEKHVQPLLDAVFAKNAARFKELGIKDGTHLSIVPAAGAGKYAVVKWDGGPVTTPNGQGGLEVNYISSADIQAARKAGVDREKAEGVKAMERRMQDRKSMAPYKPDNLLRKLFGYGPLPE
jgi:hypothetical protein